MFAIVEYLTHSLQEILETQPIFSCWILGIQYIDRPSRSSQGLVGLDLMLDDRMLCYHVEDTFHIYGYIWIYPPYM